MGREQRKLEQARAKELELVHREVALLKRTLGWVQKSEDPERAGRRERSPMPVEDEDKPENPLTNSLDEDEEKQSFLTGLFLDGTIQIPFSISHIRSSHRKNELHL